MESITPAIVESHSDPFKCSEIRRNLNRLTRFNKENLIVNGYATGDAIALEARAGNDAASDADSNAQFKFALDLLVVIFPWDEKDPTMNIGRLGDITYFHHRWINKALLESQMETCAGLIQKDSDFVSMQFGVQAHMMKKISAGSLKAKLSVINLILQQTFNIQVKNDSTDRQMYQLIPPKLFKWDPTTSSYVPDV